ncbi:MAG: Bug family tripartite tricarboxylate transporter substrate binding protein, partial [Alphaproteobacteria bacterium]
MTKLLRATAILLALQAGPACAEGRYPEHPVRIAVGFPAGTVPDLATRLVADGLQAAFGQPVLVDNIPGAGGNVATDRVAKAKPDGHTLLMAGNGAIVINPGLYEKLPFDPGRDLVPVSQICMTPNVLVVGNDVPVRDVAGLVALARARPGALSYASSGVGTSQHLAGEMLRSAAGIDLLHVPYTGGGAFMPDVMAGRVTMTFGNIAGSLALIRDGRLRALAVSSLERSPALPDVPSMQEAGFPGFEATAWFGLMAPAGTPPTIVDRLHRETVRVLARPEAGQRLAALGAVPIGNSPQEFAAAI